MIVTVTMNPSTDRTVLLESRLERGEVQRAVSTREDPGGKGVNVARALLASGVEATAILPGAIDDPFLGLLSAAHVPTLTVAIDGRIRSNLTITEPGGTTTKINEPGPTLDERAQAELVDLIVTTSDGADWLVLAGSLPPGVADDFYARVVRAVRESATHAPRVAVDTSGPALIAVVQAGLALDLIKPNAAELAELLGSSSEAELEAGPGAAIALAQSLPATQVRASLVTLGSVGAALVTADGTWFARAPRVEARSTVGAGDSSLAGYLVASTEGAAPAAALARAVASGAAAVSLPGSIVPTREQVDPSVVDVTPVGDAADLPKELS